jgi:ComF family protein
LGRLVGEVIARTVAPLPRSALVPIPLGARRLRQRGYNQAAVIAAQLAQRWEVSCDPGLLIRTRETRTQTELAPDERELNVAKAFFAAPPPSNLPAELAHIILVDDVLTTGATLAAAASAMQESGWSSVGAVTFARALPFEVRVVHGGSASTSAPDSS